MADNVSITAGSGTVIAADEVTRNAISEKQQIIKISLGAEGAFDTLVDSGQQTMANSLPVVLASNQTSLPVTQSTAEAVLQALASVDFSSLSTSYTNLITPAGNTKVLDTVNDTDIGIIVSLDNGVTDHYYMPPKSAREIRLADINLHQSGIVRIKVPSGSGTEGKVYAQCIR